MHVTITNGEMSIATPKEGGNSYQAGQEVTPETSGLASARNPSNNMHVSPSALTGSELVNVRGIEMKLDDAVAAGAIIKRPDGSYSDGKIDTAKMDAPTQKPKAETQQPTRPPVEPLSDEAEGLLQEAPKLLSDAYVGMVVNQLSDGQELSAHIIGEMASRLHMEPHEVQEKVESIQDAFGEQAAAVVTKAGLDVTEVFTWARKNAPDMLTEAMKNHVHNRNTQGYNRVVSEYLTALPQINPGAILNAELGPGITVQQGNHGAILLNTPHGQLEWRAAVRAGMVRVSNANAPRR